MKKSRCWRVMGLYRDRPRFIITFRFSASNQLLLVVWLVSRWSSTSLSMLFSAAMSIPKAAATLDRLSPKDLRSSRKSISSPEIRILNSQGWWERNCQSFDGRRWELVRELGGSFTCHRIMQFRARAVALWPAAHVHMPRFALPRPGRHPSQLDAPWSQPPLLLP